MFKRKKKEQLEEAEVAWQDSEEWWRSPILQGDENDYGEYDYFMTPIPENSEEWIRSYARCDTCGKYHYFNKQYIGFFRTYDGWDSDSYIQCWKCQLPTLKTLIKRLVKRIKKHRRINK